MVSLGSVVVKWLSSWLGEQEVWGSISGLPTWISEIDYLLLPSHDMAEIPLKWRKSSMQPTNHQMVSQVWNGDKKYYISWIHEREPWDKSSGIFSFKHKNFHK